ncbi:hypothetical protein V8G54_036593 [Vigna mungo]|uniref:Uncharacterized protein n=1 Tax=Vigna mungo TaxID=3915 RepID=A0AAQ3MIR6_VIGMU
MRSLTEVVKHHMVELTLFEQEGFTFPDDLKFQGLNKFIAMKGDSYDELVEVFYYNVKEIDGKIYSRIKGVDIVIDDNIWWKFTGLRNEGRYRKEKGFLFKWLDKEEKVLAFIIGHILLPGRYNFTKLTPMDVCLLYAIVFRIQTNWVAVFKEHIL